MSTSGITWNAPPGGLANGVAAYVERIRRAAQVAAERLAVILEEDAKRGAPWQDRTGNARRDLSGAVDVANEMIMVYLSHGPDISYGPFLETLRGGRYAIVLRTVEVRAEEIFQLIAAELGS